MRVNQQPKVNTTSVIRLLLLVFFVFNVVSRLNAQSKEIQHIEINLSIDFKNNTAKISYLLSPPAGNYTAEYLIETHSQSIQHFKKYLLKPLEETAYQYDGKKLSFQHSNMRFLKYYFDIEIPLIHLQNDLILTENKNSMLFHFNEQTFNKLIPKPVRQNYRISLSVCSSTKFTFNGAAFYSFTDKKSNSECIFTNPLSQQDLQKINIAFDKPIVIATARGSQTSKPTAQASSSAMSNQAAEPLNRDTRPETQHSTVTGHQPASSNRIETKITSSSSQPSLSTLNPCYTLLSEPLFQCQTDSALYPGAFYLPKNPYYFLMPKELTRESICYQTALNHCNKNIDITDIINAFDLVNEILQSETPFHSVITLRNIVDNHGKNSNYLNSKRLYYIILFYNIYFHYGSEMLRDLRKEFIAELNQRNIDEILENKKIQTDINRIEFSKEKSNALNVTYEIKISSNTNIVKIQFTDEHYLIKKGTLLRWVAYRKDQKIDTIITPTNGEKYMTFEISSPSEILFLYPQWEEYIMIPTREIRPEYQALLELNYGYTPLHRYRAFRTMIATGNPNLLATAVSLALDDSLAEIRNFGFERLDEVPEFQIRKVKDGILKGIGHTDAFTRPVAYRNAERFNLPVKRPAISDQKGQDLYADLLVMTQFEGLKATEMALESFIEGNTDPGIIWFLAEKGDQEMVDLLLTFERGISFEEAFKRISIVFQALMFTSINKANHINFPEKGYLSEKLYNAGMNASDVDILWKNLELNIQLFKASFTN